MKKIILTDEEYDILIEELVSLGSYQWNDDNIHADDCGSQSLLTIYDKVKDNTARVCENGKS